MRSTLIAAALANCSIIVLAQAPPVKMGLWEKKMVTSNGAGEPAAITSKSCITVAAWQEMEANASKPHDGCTLNNVKNAHGYSFNGTCALPEGETIAINGSLNIKDDQHIVSESHTVTTIKGQKRQIDS